MEDQAGQITFRDLDGNIPIPEPTWPLEEWYAHVRDTKIGEFEVADLARACRQDMYPGVVVPIALAALERDPLAGELYDGELVHSLAKVPGPYWASHPAERARFLELAQRAYEKAGDDHLRITERDLLQGG